MSRKQTQNSSRLTKLKALARYVKAFEKFSDDTSAKLIRGEKVADEVYIDNIQYALQKRFPWVLLEKKEPALTRTKTLDAPTLKLMAQVKEIFQSLRLQAGITAIEQIEEGDLQHGSDMLVDAIWALKQALKEDKESGAEKWDANRKLTYINMSDYPVYFPKPWQAKNLAIQYTAKGTGRKYVVPKSIKDLEKAQTPKFNHFLTWGPNCPGCGMNAKDPRYMRLKSKYPQAFSYARSKERMKHQHWSPVIPSPGLKPFVAPPPQGSAYYSDPNDPRPEDEGVRFFDAEDERLYYDYLEKYQQFKEEFGKEAEAYNQLYFEAFPHKATRSRYESPNEWSTAYYGREKPLWEDDTERPSAAELKRRIQERPDTRIE